MTKETRSMFCLTSFKYPSRPHTGDCDDCENGYCHTTNAGRRVVERCETCKVLVNDDDACNLHGEMCGCDWYDDLPKEREVA